MTVPAEAFLQDQLPQKYQRHIRSALQTAYAAAAQLAADEPILATASATDNHGRLISWATDLAIEKLITTGVWPFDYAWVHFNRPTGRFLRVELPDSYLSISKVSCFKKPPRKVGFRGNAALSNQSYLFESMEQERKRIVGQPSFVLVHGHKSLNFAHIGMSEPNQNEWIYRTGNLLDMVHSIENSDLPPVESTEESVLTLKQDIEKWRRDQNE
ncbi:hypothetical protein [Salinicola lusitanus]|uniref:hypothetical protein n=1 Tax=Salinicola lusitanus TaxID=1949085 RepID=UPI00130021E7|nr:hypothetical protein [Salinicola lusitanus]